MAKRIGEPFIPLLRKSDSAVLDLIRNRPSAWCLFTCIAFRVNLQTGKTKIKASDYGSKERNYRTDKQCLEDLRWVKFVPTNKGTIAILLDNPVFSIGETGKRQTRDRQNDRQRDRQIIEENEARETGRETDKVRANGKKETGYQAAKEQEQEAAAIAATKNSKNRHSLRLEQFADKFGNPRNPAFTSEVWEQAINLTYQRYLSGYPGKRWDRLIALKAQDLAEGKQSQPAGDELPPGEWNNGDGTWTIVRTENGKRKEETMSTEKYFKWLDSKGSDA